MLSIAVLPGDGIGAEVMDAALPVFQALEVPVQCHFADIGWSFWQKEGNPIPQRTWEIIHKTDTVLLGATTSKPKREAIQEKAKDSSLEYKSPILQLRQNMDLFANVRPCFNLSKKGKAFNFCIIRENSEGLYAGFDFHPIPPEIKRILSSQWQELEDEEISCTLRLQSKAGLCRIFQFAFEYAKNHNMTKITLADKPNVLRQSSAFSRELFEAVACQFPHIEANIVNVDALAMSLIRRPETFGVIVAENMFGDILSDVGAGMMGGLGFAPSANIGNKRCYFEPVHGSGPNVPKNRANPCAMFLTIGLLLKHFGFEKQSNRIKWAIKTVIDKGQTLTYDLAGSSSTREMAEAIINHVL